MRIELVPDRGPDDPAARAAAAAVAREGFAADEEPLRTSAAWRRAGVREAVERDPGADSGPGGHASRPSLDAGLKPGRRSARPV
jgi:hypothetical protein